MKLFQRALLVLFVFVTTAAVVPVLSAAPAQAACSGSNGMRGWLNIQYSSLMYGPNCYNANASGNKLAQGVNPENAMSSGKDNNPNAKYCGVDTAGIWPSVTVIIFYNGTYVNDFRAFPGAQDSIDQFDIMQTGATCPAPTS